MNIRRHKSRSTRYLVCTALAAAAVTGGVTAGPLDILGPSKAVASESTKKEDKAVKKAERVVERNPVDAAARSDLAYAYLKAGRFESAIEAFEDSRQLGQDSARNALSLSLAHVASGDNSTALAILDQWRDSIPASDFGLALALAGETGRGITVLSDALRSGEDSAKLRQNLAYAYALDGRWREARLMAAQDVPADQIDGRISDWAQQARADDFRLRVASLVGAPVRSDAGQPHYLALAVPAPEAAPEAELADASLESDAVPATQDDGELPPLGNGESFWMADATKPEGDNQASETQFDEAFSANDSSQRFVSRPVVQPLPASAKPAEAVPVTAKTAPADVEAAPAVADAKPVRNSTFRSAKGSHLVQLGSFSSEANAQRAIKIYAERHPELSEDDMTITQAIVRGKHYWRVSAAGYNRRSAASMCSTVKTRGGGCIAYSASHPLPGALPANTSSGQMLARRQ